VRDSLDWIVSEMTYTVSSGTLNSSIPYLRLDALTVTQPTVSKLWRSSILRVRISPLVHFCIKISKLIYSCTAVYPSGNCLCRDLKLSCWPVHCKLQIELLLDWQLHNTCWLSCVFACVCLICCYSVHARRTLIWWRRERVICRNRSATLVCLEFLSLLPSTHSSKSLCHTCYWVLSWLHSHHISAVVVCQWSGLQMYSSFSVYWCWWWFLL